MGALALALASEGVGADLLDLSNTPLLVSSSVPSNLMLMMDTSGSMNAIAPVPPYDPSAVQASCPAANLVPTDLQVELYVADSPSAEPRIALSVRLPSETSGSPEALVDEVFPFGTGAGQRCFDPGPGIHYAARLRATQNDGTDDGSRDNIGGLQYRVPVGYPPSSYTGHFLNWYFNPNNAAKAWNSGEPVKPLDAQTFASSRGQVAKSAAVTLAGTLDERLRVGLSSYNGDSGGTLNLGIAPMSKAHRESLIERLNGLEFKDSAPLAETLAGIGRYFTTGYGSSGRLTLHPGQVSESTRGISELLPTLKDAEKFPAPPISASCQQTSVALLIGGLPNDDRDISEPLRDYDGDCSGVNAARCLSEPSYDRKLGRTYEAAGSDYIDDVAQALHEIDLRPDFPDEPASQSQFRNNITTHVIGFGDENVNGDPLFAETAAQGGGRFFTAHEAPDLSDAFAGIVSGVLDRSGGFSAVTLNTTILTESTRVFQARFSSSDWSGDLTSTPIATGAAGGSCAGVGTGELCAVEWSASEQLETLSPDSRVILTYKPSTAAGVAFRWAHLDDAQKSLLNINFNHATNTGTADSRGEDRLEYLRGDRSLEGPGGFRVRGGRLGDIIDSDPIFVGPPNQSYTLPGYAAYRLAQKDRVSAVYVGANDGMLHAFRASDGREILGYVPNALFGRVAEPKLAKLTSNPYLHTWGVDGSLAATDIQVASGGTSADWRTYLVGTFEYGGQGLFALDVTNPAAFAEDNAENIVKWEFTDANSGIDGRDLGRSFSQPFIVKMKNGKWATIVGNGYNNVEPDGHASSTGQAALFVIFMEGPGADGIWEVGSEYLKLGVPGGSATTPNGMAAAAPVDIDGDGLIDYVYAGDLLGNLWQFDVNSADPGNWNIGYGSAGTPQPLFVAKDHTGARQPITAAPEVGLNLLTPGDPNDIIVFFGTGRFIAGGDNTASGQQNQSFYGIFDNPIAAATDPVTISAPTQRSQLLQQKIEGETTVNGNRLRVTSDENLDIGRHKGWFIDLFDTEGEADADAAAPGTHRGERQITRPVLRGGRIVFTTLIPSSGPCDVGGGGGFLMELDAQTGARPSQPALDITNDITVDQQDRIKLPLDGTAVPVAPSGVASDTGILSQPSILAIPPRRELKIMSTSSGGTEVRGEAGYSRTGRITWREINP